MCKLERSPQNIFRVLYFPDSEIVQKVTSHPVHIVNEDRSLSPTALIPFCDFGNNMYAMGVKIDQFSVPVCKSFEPKVVNDQLCYEMDPNKHINDKNIV